MNNGAITVQVELTGDGRLQVKSNAPNVLLAVGMLEGAKASVLAQHNTPAPPPRPGLSLPPAGLNGDNLRAQGQ